MVDRDHFIDSKNIGIVYIDQTIGFIVKYAEAGESGIVEFEVLEINSTDAGIPAYK